jgi:hypothetical protein
VAATDNFRMFVAVAGPHGPADTTTTMADWCILAARSLAHQAAAPSRLASPDRSARTRTMRLMPRSSPVPLHRRWIADIIHVGRKGHTVGADLVVNVAAAAAARTARQSPVSWVSIWVRAVGLGPVRGSIWFDINELFDQFASRAIRQASAARFSILRIGSSPTPEPSSEARGRCSGIR